MQSARLCLIGLAALVACCLLAAPALARSAGWPRLRGPNRDGSTPDSSGWPKGWPPKKLWSFDAGRGCTSPILAGGRVYVMGWYGRAHRRQNRLGRDVVRCLDARTGKTLWSASCKARYQGRLRTGDTNWYGGPNATPAVDRKAKRLVTLGVDGDLRCWDATTGVPLWSRNLHDAYKVRQRPDVGGGRRDFGFCAAPLLLGDAVIVEVGAAEGTVMAFDAATGTQRWVSALKGAAGHSGGPCPISVGETPCLAVLTLTKLVVMRLDHGHEGETLAEHPWRTDFGCNLAAPTRVARGVLLTADYNTKRTEWVGITKAGTTRIWQSRSRSMVSSPAVANGRAYLVWQRVHCIDLKSGRRIWQGGNAYHGSCLATGDGKILVHAKPGLLLLDGGDGYKQLARVPDVCPDIPFPQVVLAGGIILCKDRSGRLVALSVTEQ
jgi:hypothetical protein